MLLDINDVLITTFTQSRWLGQQERLETITGFMVEKATTLHSFLNMYLPQPHDYDVKIS